MLFDIIKNYLKQGNIHVQSHKNYDHQACRKA